MHRHRHHRTNDLGLTLPELVVAIALMGVIATVVAGMIGVTLRNNPMVEMRTDEAHIMQGITTWLPQDVDSTPPGGFDTDASAPSGCTDSPGINLLTMSWTERIGSLTTRYVASYRSAVRGTDAVVQRVTCNGTGAGTLGNSVVQNVAGPLKAMPVGWSAGDLPARVVVDSASGQTSVVVDLQTVDGRILSVLAAPKNPANTLPANPLDPTIPPVTTALATTTTEEPPPPPTTLDPTATTVPEPTTSTTSTTSTTTTSTTTTTTLPPCQVSSSSMSATSIKNTPPGGNGKSAANPGVLSVALTITAQTNGYCAGMSAQVTTGATNVQLFRNFTVTAGSTMQVTFPGYPQGSSELWADGTRVIEFYAPSSTTARGSVTLEVK